MDGQATVEMDLEDACSQVRAQAAKTKLVFENTFQVRLLKSAHYCNAVIGGLSGAA